jgi:Helix-loop-helix DNA-binding domain
LFPFAAEIQDLSPENSHYSETVSIIFQHSQMLHSNSNLNPKLSTSSNSVFTRWSSTRILPPLIPEGNVKISQHLLKKVLIDTSNLHCSSKDGNLEKGKDSEAGECGGRLKKSSSVQDELSANHVLAERRRREKLNERFIILRSLVPFVTKVHTFIVYSFFMSLYTIHICGSTV